MNTARHKNIVFEYKLTKKNQNKSIIILTGIPGAPKSYDFFDDLVEEGYNVFYPRYEGTWESSGEFLKRHPAEAIDELIDYLHNGATFDGVKDNASDIYILGSSFGGYVALSLTDTKYIKSVCVLSPVVSYKEVSQIETLENHILEKYPDDYRFKHDNWNKMLDDKLKSPINGISLSSDKILLIAGKEDMQIASKDLEKFSKDKGIKNFLKIDAKHITLPKTNKGLLQKILTFFNPKN